ncbi:hypothetical protein ACKWTF_000946 [Chironomus riparius]
MNNFAVLLLSILVISTILLQINAQSDDNNKVNRCPIKGRRCGAFQYFDIRDCACKCLVLGPKCKLTTTTMPVTVTSSSTATSTSTVTSSSTASSTMTMADDT